MEHSAFAKNEPSCGKKLLKPENVHLNVDLKLSGSSVSLRPHAYF